MHFNNYSPYKNNSIIRDRKEMTIACLIIINSVTIKILHTFIIRRKFRLRVSQYHSTVTLKYAYLQKI
jgi:hypothetical protein